MLFSLGIIDIVSVTDSNCCAGMSIIDFYSLFMLFSLRTLLPKAIFYCLKESLSKFHPYDSVLHLSIATSFFIIVFIYVDSYE